MSSNIKAIVLNSVIFFIYKCVSEIVKDFGIKVIHRMVCHLFNERIVALTEGKHITHSRSEVAVTPQHCFYVVSTLIVYS